MADFNAWLQQLVDGGFITALDKTNVQARFAGFGPLAVVTTKELQEVLSDNGYQLKLAAAANLVGGVKDAERAAAQAAAAPAAGEAMSSSLLEQMKSMLHQEFEDHRQASEKAAPKGFSNANTSDAHRLLQELNLAEVDGNAVAPFELPEGTPECDVFNYGNYASEDHGTPDLVKHHCKQLEKFKVFFGRGGYGVYDLHACSCLYTYQTSSGALTGNVDACVAPFGLFPPSAAERAPVVYEHKQSEAQKQQYADAHPEITRKSKKRPAPVNFHSHKGQVVTALIGAYAYNRSPVMLDLTDGAQHTLLLISEGELIVWEDLPPTKAYFKQAEHLKQLSCWLGDKNGKSVNRKYQVEDIPEEERAALQQIKSAVRGESALREQLESIVPLMPASERVACAYDLIASWQCAAEPMSSAVTHMFS